jgi:hypothetical protein
MAVAIVSQNGSRRALVLLDDDHSSAPADPQRGSRDIVQHKQRWMRERQYGGETTI